MEISEKNSFLIFSGTNTRYLAEKILFAGVTEQSSLYALQNTENNKAKLITL